MLQQLDVMCGDVSIDLSEDILLGEAGLLNSLNASKKSRESSELHGVSVPESSTLELAQPTPSLETDATAAAVVAAVASGSEHISPTLEAGAAAVSAVATAESSKGRIFKVPEKVCCPSGYHNSSFCFKILYLTSRFGL